MRKRKTKCLLAVSVFVIAGMAGILCAERKEIGTLLSAEKDSIKNDVGAGKGEAAPDDAGKELLPEEGEEEEYSIIRPQGKTLETRVAVPQGYKRAKCRKNSLAGFLRGYPMKKDGSPVLLYDGSEKGSQDVHAAVFKLPLEPEDLQQCADSVMRVYAEYFWKTGQKERIKFHFVDGFLADYARWRDGGRIQAGDVTSWSDSAAYDDSYGNFKKYMRMVFAYAGTLSMEAEAEKISMEELRIGDIFIKGASPGHVVMVVDVCRNEDGKKAFLLGQGYMPAQEFHLLKNNRHEEDPWYYEEEISYPFETPEYTFEKGSLHRLKY